MSLHKFTVQEVLNKVMVEADSALKVSLHGVEINAENLNVRLTEGDDSVVAWGNTIADGSGDNKALLIDTAGHLQVDVLTAPTTAITNGNLDASISSLITAIGELKTEIEVITGCVTANELKVDAT
jgi:hypothetical protein